MLAEAAKKLGTSDLTVTDGVISGGGKKVAYAELIGGKSFSIKLDPKQPVKEKAPQDYKLVGKSLRERARELVAVAHPDFRGELSAEARRMYG